MQRITLAHSPSSRSLKIVSRSGVNANKHCVLEMALLEGCRSVWPSCQVLQGSWKVSPAGQCLTARKSCSRDLPPPIGGRILCLGTSERVVGGCRCGERDHLFSILTSALSRLQSAWQVVQRLGGQPESSGQGFQ